MEQIVVRNLPDGTKAALRARGVQSGRSVEAEVRTLIADAVGENPQSLVGLLADPEGEDIDFTPERLGLTVREPDL